MRYCPACNGFGWRRIRDGEKAEDPYVYDWDTAPARAKDKREAGWRWDEQDRKDKQRYLDRVLSDLQRNERIRNGELDQTERYPWEVAGAILRASEPVRQLTTLMYQFETLHGRIEDEIEFAKWAAEKWKGPLEAQEPPKGLKADPSRAQPGEVQILAAQGLSYTKIANRLGLTRSKVQDLLAA